MPILGKLVDLMVSCHFLYDQATQLMSPILDCSVWWDTDSILNAMRFSMRMFWEKSQNVDFFWEMMTLLTLLSSRRD